MQLDGGKIGHPYDGWQIVGQNVIDGAPVVFAPDGRGLHPIWTMRGGVLFKEEFAVYSVGIALERQRPSRQVGHKDRCNAGVVVNDLSLGETGRGIEDLVQVRQLELPTLN